MTDTVTVRMYGPIRAAAGEKSVELTGVHDGTIADVVAKLGERYGEAFEDLMLRRDGGGFQTGISVLVNGEDVRRVAGVETAMADVVDDGAVEISLEILPAIEGGQGDDDATSSGFDEVHA